VKSETKLNDNGVAMQRYQTGIVVRNQPNATESQRAKRLAALLGLAAVFSVGASAEQSHAPQAAQQPQAVQVVNTNAQPVPVQTASAVAPVWQAMANGTFNINSLGLTIPYVNSQPGKRIIVRHISVACQFSVGTQAFVQVDGYLGPLVFPLTYLPGPAGGSAVGGTPVELILDSGGFANFAIQRTAVGSDGFCRVNLSGYTVPQPSPQ
jgi:hypothetical protein